MSRQQRKFRIALFGAIAAVAAAIGGGWALHVALSYQDNSNTATNGGVVVRNNQGSPTTHTGSGDNISQGIQHKGKGNIHIQISITPKQYEAGLKRREQEVTEELKRAHAQDRQVLEKEKAEIERRLADTEASYQSYVKELQERIAQLESIRGQVPDALLDQARTALAQGDQSTADRLFAQVEAQNAAAVQATAEAAYQRSRIARDEIRYRAAYEHAQRSVRLAPENSLYLAGAGELAQILGDYSAAKAYYEQALASDLNTYGEDHPAVARDRNNLGSAWKALGEYEKAIGYLEQALAVCGRKLGPEHPNTQLVRGNLAAARAGQRP